MYVNVQGIMENYMIWEWRDWNMWKLDRLR